MSVVSEGFLLLAALLLVAYYLCPGRAQWLVLLAGSGVFYAGQSLGSQLYLLATVLCTYLTGRLLGAYQSRFDKQTAKRKGKPWLLLCLAGHFGMLLVCKVRLLSGSLLPLGISFYLFQSMGYLLDIYRGRQQPERCLGRLALFVSFFPQLLQGPISKASKLLPQLTMPHRYDSKQVSFGLQRLLWGYFKKLVIAERMAPCVQLLREEGGLFWLSCAYAVQIYGDFTGGIDMVLGLSQAMGIRLEENFCRPFFAKNTADFWRRWHISLGAWMREYVYYPVSVSPPMVRLSRFARGRLGAFGKRLPVYAASLVTWLATGLWHGLTPNFLLWGLLNWAVIVLSQELRPLYGLVPPRVKKTAAYGCFEALRTFLLMNLIRSVDLFPRVGSWFARMGSFFALPATPLLSAADWWVLLPGVGLLATVSLLQQKRGSVRELLWEKPWPLRWGLVFGLFLLVLLTGCYGIGYDPGNFIYSAF